MSAAAWGLLCNAAGCWAGAVPAPPSDGAVVVLGCAAAVASVVPWYWVIMAGGMAGAGWGGRCTTGRGAEGAWGASPNSMSSDCRGKDEGKGESEDEDSINLMPSASGGVAYVPIRSGQHTSCCCGSRTHGHHHSPSCNRWH